MTQNYLNNSKEECGAVEKVDMDLIDIPGIRYIFSVLKYY
jgi:hypothetical protein